MNNENKFGSVFNIVKDNITKKYLLFVKMATMQIN